MALNNFKSLSAKNKALVSLGVLIDGAEAETYLMTKDRGVLLASQELAKLPPETRMPLVGGMLRRALEALRKGLE